jgi:hypothetical protein
VGNVNTPDITLAQIIGGIATLLGALAGFVTFSGTWPRVAIIAGAFFVVGAWIVADAIIRHGRSRALTPTASATVQVTPTQVPPA